MSALTAAGAVVGTSTEGGAEVMALGSVAGEVGTAGGGLGA